jgi:hypothetical protein
VARLFGKKAARRFLGSKRHRLEQYPGDWHAEFVPQRCSNIIEVCDFLAAR